MAVPQAGADRVITARFEGGDRLVERIKTLPPELRKALLRTVKRLTYELQRYVMQVQLTGAVLHNVTGTLRRSIFARIIEIVDKTLGEVGTNLNYGVLHEYGGVIRHPGGTAYFLAPDGTAHFISNANILAARLPRTAPHDIPMPERSFLRSALREKEYYIRTEIINSVREYTRYHLKAA